MKKAHIVYTHPEPQSFVAAMRDTVKSQLEETGWQTTLSDLHASKFNPVASANDFRLRARSDYLVYAKEQRHGWETRSIDPVIAAEVEAVLAADLLVFVFPIYWFSVPAQLKGWFDRVMLSGAFYGGRQIYDSGGMRGKRVLVVASLGGRENMFGPNALHGDLHSMMRHLLQGTLGYVGFSVLEPHIAFHVPYVDYRSRQQMLEALALTVHSLESRPTLPMPKLMDFDEQFRPISYKNQFDEPLTKEEL